jgi:putative membrane protein
MTIRAFRLLFPAALFALSPETAAAHGGPVEPSQIASAWNLDPLVMLGVSLTAGLYLGGIRAIWSRVGAGRGITCWQVAAFFGGVLAIPVALVSPLDALGGSLFSAHMAQHLILTVVAAPLIVLGTPLVPLLWSFPLSVRQRMIRGWRSRRTMQSTLHLLSGPAFAWLLHTVALWAWHSPPLYTAALESRLVHIAEHVSLFGTALLFWWVLSPMAGRRRLGHGAGILYAFTAAMQSGVLGVLILFSASPWYDIYSNRTGAWGLTPLEDQQLAGTLMWVPAGIAYVSAGLWLFAGWLRQAERNVRAREEQALAGRTLQ